MIVENFSLQLNTHADVKMLKDVSDTLIQSGESLMQLVSNQKKMDCLEAFSECQEIVGWIREITKGLSYLM